MDKELESWENRGGGSLMISGPQRDATQPRSKAKDLAKFLKAAKDRAAELQIIISALQGGNVLE